MLETFQPFAMSLVIGLVIGIERERRSSSEHGTMGVRSFALTSLLGTTLAVINQPALTVAAVFGLVLLVALGYWRGTSKESPSDYGLTSEIAASLVLALGYLSASEPLLAGALGLIVVALLYWRTVLHDFAKEVIRPHEITAALTLAAFAFIIVPFLPDREIDPWGLFNPRKLGTIIALIATIEFAGYAASRYGGDRLGRLITGFFGGLASSTAVFATLPKQVKESRAALVPALCTGLMAHAASQLFLVGIVLVTSDELAIPVGLPVGVAALAAIAIAIALSRKSDEGSSVIDGRENPLDMRGAIRLGSVIFGLLVFTSLVQRHFGDRGVEITSFISGLFELHGITFANSALHATGQLTDRTAAFSLYMAASAAFISKIGLSFLGGVARFGFAMTGLLAVVYAFAAVAAYLVFW